MHCFGGNIKQVKEAIELGFFISISGVITFKNAQKLKEDCKVIFPDEYLMIETRCSISCT